MNILIVLKAWSLSKKSSEKEKERSKLLSALAKKPTVPGNAKTEKVRLYYNYNLFCNQNSSKISKTFNIIFQFASEI